MYANTKLMSPYFKHLFTLFPKGEDIYAELSTIVLNGTVEVKIVQNVTNNNTDNLALGKFETDLENDPNYETLLNTTYAPL